MRGDEKRSGDERSRFEWKQQRREKRQQELKEFGLQMKQMRNNADLTLKEAAERAEISTSFLGLIETGRRSPPRREALRKLLRAYGIRRGGFDLIQTADRLSVEEDWDLSETERRREKQKSVECVQGDLLKTLVEEQLDAIEPGLVAMGESLFSEEDIVAVDGSGRLVVIKVTPAKAGASTLAQLLTCFEQQETFRELAALHSPGITLLPDLRFVLVAPQFDEEVTCIARYLSVDLRMIRVSALRRAKTKEVIVNFQVC